MHSGDLIRPAPAFAHLPYRESALSGAPAAVGASSTPGASRRCGIQVTQRANTIINGNFDTHPGFNV